MGELPPRHIEIHKGDQQHILWLTTEIHSVLRIYARQNNISAIDAGNRIIFGFLTKVYGFEDPNKLLKETYKAIFPNHRAIHDAFVSLAHGKKPRRRPIPLRKDGKLPAFLTESGSTDHDNPLTS